jgi:hypothetical protein
MSTLKTGKVKTTTIADELDTESTAVTNVINGTFKQWVNFNGTGTLAILDSFNTSSVVDSGTGVYTVNLNDDYGDTNYPIFIGSNNNNINQYWAQNKTSTSYEVRFFTGSTYIDTNGITVGSMNI